MLLPFLGKDDDERRQIINTIGPVWDGNEVWMITAGGAMFASFPHVYATLFSGFYLALILMLVALILRGVAFEFRGTRESKTWRGFWDWAIFTGSLLPALLVGGDGGKLDARLRHQAGYELLRRPVAFAQPVCAAGRVGLCVPVRHARGQLPDPQSTRGNRGTRQKVCLYRLDRCHCLDRGFCGLDILLPPIS